MARAGTQTARYWGETASGQCGFANGDDEAAPCSDDYENTASAGSFQPNAFGQYDILGNLWEWVDDCYGDYEDAPGDGRACHTGDCDRRVFGGGVWNQRPDELRSAARIRSPIGRRLWTQVSDRLRGTVVSEPGPANWLDLPGGYGDAEPVRPRGRAGDLPDRRRRRVRPTLPEEIAGGPSPPNGRASQRDRELVNQVKEVQGSHSSAMLLSLRRSRMASLSSGIVGAGGSAVVLVHYLR